MISRLLSYMEKIANPKKETTMANINSYYGIPTAGGTGGAAGLTSGMGYSYAQYVGGQQIYNQQYANQQLVQAQSAQINTASQINTVYGYGGVPLSPSGQITTISFRDAYGKNWAIPVDNSVAGLMMQIDNIHGMASAQFTPVTKFKMNDADFSIDELEKAEKVMEELGYERA